MTDDEMIAAALVKTQKFGLANEDQLYDLLPEAIAEFQSAHTWEFLTNKPRTVTNVSGQDYINPGGDFWKVVALGWASVPVMDWISRQEYNARKLGGSTAVNECVNYTEIKNLIYLSPAPTGQRSFTLIDQPFETNLALNQIPGAFHNAIQKLLEALAVPWDNPVYPVVTALADKAVNGAIGVEQSRPQRRQRLELSHEQKLLNRYKYSKRRGRALPFNLTGTD